MHGINMSGRARINVTGTCNRSQKKMRERLKSEIARTGISLISLAALCSDEILSIKANKIGLWASGRTKKAQPLAWDRVINSLSDLPNA